MSGITLGSSAAQKALTADGNGHVTIADGTHNFNIASHDGQFNGLMLEGALVKATAAELNVLDGVTATTAQLNTVAAAGLSSIAGLSLSGKGGQYLKVNSAGNAFELGASRRRRLTVADSRVVAAEEVETIGGALEKLSQMRGVRFKYSATDTKSGSAHDLDLPEEQQLGVIAQEVEAVLPEAVAVGESGLKEVQLEVLPAFLVQVNKEQQAQIEAQKVQLSEQQQQLSAQQTQLSAQETEMAAMRAEMAAMRSQFAKLAALVGG